MTVVRSNTFEGGSAGTQITTGNSGGASGDAFNSVGTGIAGQPKFSTAQVKSNTRSMEVAMGASFTSSAGTVGWSFSAESLLYFRLYVYLPLGMSTNALQVVAVGGQMFTLSPTNANDFTHDGSGQGGTAPAVSFASILGRWMRLEGMVDASSNTVTIRVFRNVESDNPMESSGHPIAEGVSTITQITMGSMVGFNNPPGPFGSASVFFDDMAISTNGWIGPSGTVNRDVGASGLRDRAGERATLQQAGELGSPATAHRDRAAELAWQTPAFVTPGPPGVVAGGAGGVSVYS